MEWALDHGDRVRYRSAGEDRARLGTVRKALRILTAQLDEVPVYIVDSDEEDPVILGDGEILEKLPPDAPRSAPPPRTGEGPEPSFAEESGAGTEGTSPQERSVLLLDSDLFFVVKVTETLKHAGFVTRTARTNVDFARTLDAARPAVVVVNTAARGVDYRRAIALAHAVGLPVVAFGSHVDTETQKEARRAGATLVIANARLASDLPGALERALRRGQNRESTQSDRT